MITNSLSNSENSSNIGQISIFSFLKNENLSKEEYEQNMKVLIPTVLDEKQISEQINSIENNLGVLGDKKLINKWKNIISSNVQINIKEFNINNNKIYDH